VGILNGQRKSETFVTKYFFLILVNFILDQAVKAQRGVQVQLFSSHHTRPFSLPHYPGKETRYPLYRGLGGPQRSLDGCGKSSSRWNAIPGPSST